MKQYLRIPLKRVVHSRLGQRIVTSHIGWHYRTPVLRRPRRLSEIQHRLAIFDRSDPNQRLPSVTALVELFFEVAAAADIERFIEAGAKEAAASARARSTWPDADVVAFEANPYTYRRFVEGSTRNGVRYEHLALDERAGEVTFLVRLTDAGEPIADGQGSMLFRPDHTPGYEQVTVDAVTLDEHLDGSLRTAMWIDVEGASANVLRGAVRTMASVDVVMIEVEEQAAWTGQEWLRREVIEFFESHGLRPLARDRQSRFQFNIVFARTDLIDLPEVTAAVDRYRTAYRGN